MPQPPDADGGAGPRRSVWSVLMGFRLSTIALHTVGAVAVVVVVALAVARVAAWQVPPLVAAVITGLWCIGPRPHRPSARVSAAYAGFWTLLAGVAYCAVLNWRLPPGPGCQFDCDDAEAFVLFLLFAWAVLMAVGAATLTWAIGQPIDRLAQARAQPRRSFGGSRPRPR